MCRGRLRPSSMVPFDGEPGERAEQVGLAAMSRKMLDRLAYQQVRLLARTLLAQQRHECRFSCACVFARRLARRCIITAKINQVVRNLEGKTNVARIAPVRSPRF